jgi:hypothetical protein
LADVKLKGLFSTAFKATNDFHSAVQCCAYYQWHGRVLEMQGAASIRASPRVSIGDHHFGIGVTADLGKVKVACRRSKRFFAPCSISLWELESISDSYV